MKIITFKRNVKANNIVLALGNFDGVHVGHRELILESLKYARKNKLPCFTMTFDPHPQEVVSPGRGLCLLTTLPERLDLMRRLGVDGVIIKEFSREISKLPPEKFIYDFLVKHLKVKKVFIGYDFAFGHNRAGTISILKKLGDKYGFAVSAVNPIMTHGHIVKSSTIREMLARGNFGKAIKLLGHPYAITGKVVKGRGRGRVLGFPTANLQIVSDKLVPAHGVYVGMFGRKKCVINIGSRPTFAEERFAVEVHILKYKGNLKGKVIKVDLYKRLRDEFHFSDVEKLKEQIAKDVLTAKRLQLQAIQP
jgi:riboflavin kinase/FMN adenylyltransferase